MTAQQPLSCPSIRIAAGLIVDAAGCCLLVRKRGTTTFMQAGGKIEPHESAAQALAREIGEELGLRLPPHLPEYLGAFTAIAANETDSLGDTSTLADPAVVTELVGNRAK